MFISKLTVKKQTNIQAVLPLIQARGDDAGIGHSLLWSAFSRDAEMKRDFVWRKASRDVYYALSENVPADDQPFFDIVTRPFSLDFSSGENFMFILRACPEIKRQGAKYRSGLVSSVARERKAGGNNSGSLSEIAAEIGPDWLKKQGDRNGFSVLDVDVVGFSQERLHRPNRKIEFMDAIDFSGRLSVTDPDLFAAAIAQGIGRKKAFGCGFMMLKAPQ